MTNAPLIGAGAHSAQYTGIVLDLAPMPRPRTNRAAKRLPQELTTPSQIDAAAAMKQEMKIVPRRPKYLFIGSFNQHPSTAQARYGAATARPVQMGPGRKFRYFG